MKSLYDIQNENEKYQNELLSFILNDGDVYISNINRIRADYFTDERRLIFDAYVKLINEGRTPDVVTISEQSKVRLEDVLKVASFYSGSVIHPENLINELYEYSARKILTNLAGFISQQTQAVSEIDDIKQHIVSELRKLEQGEASKIITMHEGIQSLYTVINNNRKQQKFTGSPVGLSIVDKHMGGLQPGDLIILAGEVSHGKTSLAMTMLYNSAVVFGCKCGFISHEMTTEQVMARFAAYATGMSAKYLLIGKLYDNEVQQFGQKVSKLIEANIFIQDYIKRELSDTVNAIRMMVLQKSIKWIAVENAGNINVKGKIEDEARTAEISKTLKALALELKITIVLISHLSRTKDGKKEQPELHRLRHSGQLEADADVVMFVYRAELHGCETFDNGLSTENRAKVYIAKGRNYGLAVSYPFFDESTTYFTNDENVSNSNENEPAF